MHHFKIITYKGKNIVVLDLSGTNPQESTRAIQAAQKKIAEMPRKSVLLLTDVTDAAINLTSANAMKDFSIKNIPFIKASASVGSVDIRETLLKVIMAATGRKIEACKTREEAMDWLVCQGEISEEINKQKSGLSE